MSRRILHGLLSVAGAIALLGLPSAAAAKPPAGECPKSFTEKSAFDTPPSFWDYALKIDANDDEWVCFKPMANGEATNVIDNVSHNR